jgi:hypothetical protein
MTPHRWRERGANGQSKPRAAAGPAQAGQPPVLEYRSGHGPRGACWRYAAPVDQGLRHRGVEQFARAACARPAAVSTAVAAPSPCAAHFAAGTNGRRNGYAGGDTQFHRPWPSKLAPYRPTICRGVNEVSAADEVNTPTPFASPHATDPECSAASRPVPASGCGRLRLASCRSPPAGGTV